jgi:hypothetical protein
MIDITLKRTNVFMRFRCTVCGGSTDKENVTAENREAGILASGERVEARSILVCQECIKAGDIDDRLLRHACEMTDYSAYLMSLSGKLKVPTHAEWQAAEERADLEYLYGENPTEAEIAAFRIEREAERERNRAAWAKATKAGEINEFQF